MSTKEQYWKYSLIVIILFMESSSSAKSLLFWGLLGALTIYILVRGQMNHLVEKRKLNRSISALLITAETIFVFLIPLGLTVWMVAKQVTGYQSGSTDLYCTYSTGGRIHRKENRIRCIGERYAVIHHVHTSPYRINYNGKHQRPAINLFVMIFCALLHADWREKMEAYVNDILPFNETNTRSHSRKSNVVQCYRYSLTGYHRRRGYDRLSAFRSTDILMLDSTCFATIIPMVGTALVWFPVALILPSAETGSTPSGFWLWSYRRIAIGQSHPVHPSKKMADTSDGYHYFRVVISMPIFGVYGSHLRSVAAFIILSFVDMFKKEYLDLRNNLPIEITKLPKNCVLCGCKTTLKFDGNIYIQYCRTDSFIGGRYSFYHPAHLLFQFVQSNTCPQ